MMENNFPRTKLNMDLFPLLKSHSGFEDTSCLLTAQIPIQVELIPFKGLCFKFQNIPWAYIYWCVRDKIINKIIFYESIL